jgi:hypothetical protein
MLAFFKVEDRTYRLEFLLCTLTPEVQCRLVHRNHVIWRTKIQNFDGMEMIRNNRIACVSFSELEN